MPRAEVRATPGVLGALAGVVHSCQGAPDCYEHQRRHNDGYGSLHLCGLAAVNGARPGAQNKSRFR